MDVLQFIRQMQEIYGDELIKPASELPRPQQALDREMFETAFKDKKADGGRIGFDGGGSPLQRLRQEIVDSMRPYAPGNVTEDQLQLIVKDITLDMTAEQAQTSAKNNFIKLFGMAEGGRAGYNSGQLVKPSADGLRPGYSGPKKMKTGEHKGKYKFTVGRAPERVEYFDKIKDGEAWQKENRKRQGYDVEQGKKISMAEKNRAARNMFGKQYNELPAQGPKSQKVVYDRLYGQFKTKQKNPGKFRKKTLYTPLSETNKAKIKKEFPNADFSKGKLGFATSDPEYFKVSQFIERGYNKPYERGKFKSLTKYQQQELTKNFPEVEFDFDRSNVIFSKEGARFSKYGVPFTHPKYSRIAKFFNEVKPIRYRFDLADAGGWMMAQMDRAALQGDERYKPILEKPNQPVSTKNKIIGIETDGVKYTMKNIKDHPDYKNTKKYHNIAKKTSQKLIYDFKNLAELLPEGFDPKKIQLNDLLQFISNKDGIEGLNRAKRAIQIHHEYGVGKKATGGYQLLREDLNLLANKTTNLIESGDPRKVKKGAAEALLKNTRLVINNSRFGGKAVGPRKDVEAIVSQAESELKKFTKKDFSKFKTLLADLGCPKSLQKASGGRVKYSSGSSCSIKGRKVLEQGLRDGFEKGAQGDLARKILQAGKGLKDFASIRGLLGPAALSLLALEEAGYVTYDVLSKGKSFKEAIGESTFNYLLGDRTRVDAIEERNKRMKEEGMTEQQMGKIAAFESALKEQDRVMDIYNKIDQAQAGQSFQPTSDFSYLPDTTDYYKRQEDKARGDLREAFKTLPLIENVDYQGGAEALAEGLRRNELAQLRSVDNIFQSARGDAARDARKRELMLQNPDILNYMGPYPTTLGFARGGLSGGDTSGPPPEKGPMSQGLLSLYKNGRKL